MSEGPETTHGAMDLLAEPASVVIRSPDELVQAPNPSAQLKFGRNRLFRRTIALPKSISIDPLARRDARRHSSCLYDGDGVRRLAPHERGVTGSTTGHEINRILR